MPNYFNGLTPGGYSLGCMGARVASSARDGLLQERGPVDFSSSLVVHANSADFTSTEATDDKVLPIWSQCGTLSIPADDAGNTRVPRKAETRWLAGNCRWSAPCQNTANQYEYLPHGLEEQATRWLVFHPPAIMSETEAQVA